MKSEKKKLDESSQGEPPETEETLEEALLTFKQQIAHQNTQPLELFLRTKTDMNNLAAQLGTVDTPQAAQAIIDNLENYLSRSLVRHQALEAFLVPAWKWLEPLIEKAPTDGDLVAIDSYPPDLQVKLTTMITIWEHLFRDFPAEMSRTYLFLGRQIKPFKQAYFRRFVRWVSKRLGRDVDKIVDEQIPSLS
jgi:hypothetical protein